MSLVKRVTILSETRAEHLIGRISRKIVYFAFLWVGFSGCGQTAKPVVAPSSGDVHTYFGGPGLTGQTDPYLRSSITIDHSLNTITASTVSVDQPTLVPNLTGTFTTSSAGFLNISQTINNNLSFANPPLTGAWLVEIPGVGAMGNLLTATQSNGLGTPPVVHPAPIVMIEDGACPNFPKPASFFFLTPGQGAFGTVDIGTQGTAVNFQISSSNLGNPLAPPSSFSATGGCSDSVLGPLTGYPLNGQFSNSVSPDVVALGTSGFIIISSRGARQGLLSGASALGLAVSPAPLDSNALTAAHYSGFVFAPNETVFLNPPFDLTTLASSFGDNTPASPACTTLTNSLKKQSLSPSAFSLFGGEYPNNNPTAANAVENCDMVIDLGIQDEKNNGLFPNATVFIGSNYPFFPDDPNNPPPPPPAAAYPAVAIAAQVQGRYVIFVSTNAGLPDQFGNLGVQAVGIYLFQKSQ